MDGLSTLRGVARLERGDDVISEVAGGLADDASMQPCTAGLRFQLASVSKQFTAAAILLLAGKGAVSVDDPVDRWIGGCPPSWQPITVRHLLTHTAGLSHWKGIPGITLTASMDPGDELSAFQHAPLLSGPGVTWSYSSPGYVLLAHIVQRAADLPYAAFLADQIFGPLGMTSTFAGNAAGRELVATGHVGGEPVAPFELDVVGMRTGDIWSTAEDVSRWDAALEGASLLSAGWRDEMFAIQASLGEVSDTGAFVADGYGFGWFVGTVFSRRAAFHPGDNAGCRAFNVLLPDEHVRLVILSNEIDTDVEQIAAELLEPLFSPAV